MARALYTSKGTPVDIGRELGKGGEGSVFEVPSLGDQVAKLYHRAPDAEKQAKLRFMASTSDAQLLNYVAGSGGMRLGLTPMRARASPMRSAVSGWVRR